MGACAALDCTTRERIKATTDIAGPGVLYAYLVSALLAVAAVAFGYLSDSLPAWYLNETDEAVIASFQAWLPSGKNMALLNWLYKKSKTICCFGRPSSQHRKLSRQQRQEVMTRFVLTLSDQQLATGLAILIAAVANQCTLSVWEFQLAFSLAWFSSTTHLATLDCLREYFLTHGAVHNWRVFGMIALLLLLMYSLIINLASVDVTLPVSCTFLYFGDRGIYDQTNLKIADILSVSLTLVILTWQYVVRIRWSYRATDDKPSLVDRTLFSLQTRQLRKALQPTKRELNIVLEEAVAEYDSTSRRRELERIRISKGLQRHWLVAWRASCTYSGSFLSLGPMLCFMISFGFTQLYVNRWHSSAPVEIDASMSVGQIIPLFLLVLPPLVAAESYYGTSYPVV
ncbi:hypothetical protein DE146DRAFT_634032 [Phaeosphaeria sp. MPI-PUGE-AT-0046c]|nr:hypothetical protein DE146DRAFT_634032 [Phaeosphaeria sp. MPI-PUGE-AT-0046c]